MSQRKKTKSEHLVAEIALLIRFLRRARLMFRRSVQRSWFGKIRRERRDLQTNQTEGNEANKGSKPAPTLPAKRRDALPRVPPYNLFEWPERIRGCVPSTKFREVLV